MDFSSVVTFAVSSYVLSVMLTVLALGTWASSVCLLYICLHHISVDKL